MTKPIHKIHGTFGEELPGLLSEIKEILPDGDGHKIFDLLERLMTYKDLNDTQQTIVQNYMDALVLRGLLPPDDYLTDVQVDHGSILGDGAFGHVYKGKWKGGPVAVKKFRPVTTPEHIKGLHREKFIQHVEPFKCFFREIVQWKTVSNFEYVWPLLGLTMWWDRDEKTVVFALVSPLAEGHLKLRYNEWRCLSPKGFANYFHDVASGLQSLHAHGVIHGDIRPENILLYRGHCYLTDFGISTSIHPSSSFSFVPAMTKVLPPEIMGGSVTQFNKNTDIFSFGYTMYKVLAWKAPDSATEYPPRPESRRDQEWDAVWDLVLCCISQEHTNRPTALQLAQRLKAI